MNLLRRIEKLEAARGKDIDAAARRMAADMRRYFASLSDEELDSMITEDEGERRDPQELARLAEMTDEEICLEILRGELT